MGMNTQGKIFWLGKKVHPSEIKRIYEVVLKKNGPIRLDVDALNLFHKLKTRHDSYDSTLKACAKKMYVLASYGFVLTAVFDGFDRPDSKRASWERARGRVLSEYNRQYSFNTALSLSTELHSGKKELQEREKNNLKEKIKILNENYVSLEKETESIPRTFKEDLEMYIYREKEEVRMPSDGYVNETVLEAEFQADSLIARRILHGDADGVVSNDTDNGTYLGPNYFIIRSIEKQSTKDEEHNVLCEISGYSNKLLEKIQEVITRDTIVWSDCKNPLLDFQSPLMRCLVSITIGNDVWPGLEGYSAANVRNLLDGMYKELGGEEENEEKFMELIVKKSKNKKLTREVLLTLYESMIYEPAVEKGAARFEYIYDRPKKLPKILSYYKHSSDNDIAIVDGPSFHICTGICGYTMPHRYLDAEPTYTCVECSSSFCRTCGFVKANLSDTNKKKIYHTDKKETLCMLCYRTCSIDEDDKNREKISIASMRKYLTEVQHVPLTEETIPTEIEEMYYEYMKKSPLFHEKSKSLKFPRHHINHFDTLQKDVFYNGPIFSMTGFLNNRKISDELVPEIMRTFISILKHKPPGSSPYAKACCGIVIDFANGSRLNSGNTAFRLLRNACRHSTDERTRPILRENVQLFRNTDGTVGMILENFIPPTMNKEHYKTKTAFTMKELLCCDCTCWSSGKGTNDTRVTCTHNLPLIMQLSLAFDRGYLAHFLSDCATRWDSNIEEAFKKKRIKYNELLRDLKMVMRNTAGVQEREMELLEGKDKVLDLLEQFKSRTCLPNIEVHKPPNSYDLILFRDMKIISNERFAAEERQRGWSEKSAENVNNNENKTDDCEPTMKKMKLDTPPAEASAVLHHDEKMLTTSSTQKMKREINDLYPSTPPSTSETHVPKKVKIKEEESSANVLIDCATHDQTQSSQTQTQTQRLDDASLAHLDKNRIINELKVRFVHHEDITDLSDDITLENDDDDDNSTTENSPDQVFNIKSVDQTKMNTAWKTAPNEYYEKNIINLKTETVSEKNFLTLDDDISLDDQSKWLSDEIINSYMDLLKRLDERQNPLNRSRFYNSQFMYQLLDYHGYEYKRVSRFTRKIPGKDIFSSRYLFVPINISKLHWSLLIGDIKQKRLSYVDSCKKLVNGDRYLCGFMKYLKDVSEKQLKKKLNENEWTLEKIHGCAQQENSFDCGLFVLLQSFLKLHDIPFHFSQSDVNRCSSRRIIAHNLLEASRILNDKKIRHKKIDVFTPIEVSMQSIERDMEIETVVYSEPVLAAKPTRIRKAPGGICDVDAETSSSREQLENNTEKRNNNNKVKVEPVDSDDEADNDDDSIFNTTSNNSKKEPSSKDKYPRDEHDLPIFNKFDVDYIQLEKLLNVIFEENIPHDFVGYKLIKMRAALQRRNLNRKDKKQYLESLTRKIKNDWKSMCLDTAEQRISFSEKQEIESSAVIEYEKNKKTSNEYKGRRTCAFAGCMNTHKTPNLTFQSVPAKGKPNPKRKQPRDLVNYHGRNLLHAEVKKRMGLPARQTGDLRICSCHEKEFITVPHIIHRPDKKPIFAEYKMCVPVGVGVKAESVTADPSRGLGLDRAAYAVSKNIVNDGNEKIHLYLLRRLAEKDNIYDDDEIKKRDKQYVSTTVQRILGIEKAPSQTEKLRVKVVPKIGKKKDKIIKSLKETTDKQVKKETGFKSKKHLLGFIAISCNANFENITKTSTSNLTWFEEWYLFFENIWRRTVTRAEDVAEKYHVKTLTRNKIINDKIDKILTCRESWGRYCTHEEDLAMRGEKWEGLLSEAERVIMHDTTSLRCTYKPSRAMYQRLTYNRYYAGNVAKGNVSLQLCGWIRTDHLWVGGTSDDQYMMKTRIFEHQEDFANKDPWRKTYLAFLNILDRGYRLTAHAFKCGKQLVRQPVFKNKTRRFTGYETLKSASTAGIRSGNERAVGRVKLCGWLRKGLLPGECPKRFDDVWLCWGFMVNFMYGSVA